MVLKQVAYSITHNEYIWIRQEVAELRDNCPATGELHDLFISANAFLNTEGGDIFIGILDDEDNNCFVFKGYDYSNEEQLKLLPWAFADSAGAPVDLSGIIDFEMVPFLDGKVLAIHIQAVPEDIRPVYYRNTAWERLPSGNRKLAKGTAAETTDTGDSKIIMAAGAGAEQKPQDETIDETIEAETIVATDTGEAPAPAQPHTAFLISVFGSDFISLQPESKQLLSYIYDVNGKQIQPDLEELAHRLTAINNANTTLLPITEKTARKTIQLLEKNRFLVRRKGTGFSINTDYQLVQNLFS
jgi:hypothetical protein